MATLKEVQLKIVGVKKTKQITNAMKMVATSRLRGNQLAMEQFRPYAAKYAEVLGSLSEKAGGEASPLLIPKENVKKVHIVLCTDDKGLCGSFNSNLLKKVDNYIKDNSDKGYEFSLSSFGKKGADWAKKQGLEVKTALEGKLTFSDASNSGRNLIDGFLNGDYDKVVLIYSEFKNMASQKPVVKQVLPIPAIEKIEEEEDKPFQAEHICEPDPAQLLNEMLPKNVYIQIFSAILETATSKEAARMTAMDNATKACEDLIDELVTIYNKARQAAITNDLMDIVSGAEALKG
ncbi:MAG: ATP synthase F1 subunit gamma [Desulfobacterales bacterium]|nr:ATP synthase F1 subunit gamma [Desulfobacterales bacterium]MCP4162388.1 ATP synthase F1 subunit gamma [Deltaproteobacteria bacterium]